MLNLKILDMNSDLNKQKTIVGIALRIEIREKPWDLVVVVVLAALLAGVALAAQTGALRIVLGLAFILFLPGYVIVSALFPKAEDFDTIERIALSFGISIAVVPLIGLMLNYTPWGIRLGPILASLFILIVSVSIIAWFRRIQVPAEDRFAIVIPLEMPKWEEVTTFDKILIIIIIILIIIIASTLIYVITVPREGERFTEFYLLNENGTAENYPGDLTVGENGTVIVGVICREHERTTYTVEIGLVNMTGERTNRTLGGYNLTLKHDQQNETFFNFNVSETGSYKLRFLLYKNDGTEPYREVHLWIVVRP